MKEYKFVGADDIYQLFDLAKFGFNPKEVDTACCKWFVIYFIVNKNDELILDMHDRNNNYLSMELMDMAITFIKILIYYWQEKDYDLRKSRHLMK